jgi:putative ABC transport system permease protein
MPSTPGAIVASASPFPTDSALRTLRTTIRSLARQRSLVVIVVLTLALGIGGATALFSAANGVLLRPLPIREQGEVMIAYRRDMSRQLHEEGMSEDVILRFGESSRTFSAVAPAIQEPFRFPMRIGEETLFGNGALVGGGWFGLLDAQPLLGRGLMPDDDVIGAEPVAVIGQDMWERWYGADPNVIGKEIRFGGLERTIVGVMPRSFSLPQGAEFWAPVTVFAQNGERPQGQFLTLVGRLAPGATPDEAEAELAAYLRMRAEENPAQMPNPGANVVPIADTVVGNVRPVIMVLAAASGLLLAIACFNVANLLLMRGIARQREYAVRAALGAGRGRLVWQRLLESLILGLAGGVLGVAAAYVAMRLLLSRAPVDIPRLNEIGMDGRVLLLAVIVSVVAALVAGVAPALWAGRTDPGAILRGGGRAVTESRGTRLLKRGFVMGQFALTVVVLAGAALLGNSLLRLTTVDTGYRAEKVTMVPIVVSASVYDTPEKVGTLVEELIERMRQVPEVASVTGVLASPMDAPDGEGGGIPYILEGQVPEDAPGNPLTDAFPVDGAYFQTLDIQLKAGRTISEQDRQNMPDVAVVSESFAARAWPGEPPIGKRIGFVGGNEPRWFEVVGVVENTRYLSLTTERPAFYVPWRQLGAFPLTFLVRSHLEVNPLRSALLPAMREVAPGLTLPVMTPVPELLDEPLVRPRFYALLLGAFAFGSLALAAIGIYGQMAANVSERTAELGVRLTLGAMPGEVFRLVIREGMILAGIGVVIGLAAALVVTRGLGSLLYGLEPGDPVTMGVVVLVLLGAAVVACVVPAVRAARVEPAVVLREG